MSGAAQNRTFAVAGAELAGLKAGTGETVLFVHGSASDLRTWDAAVKSVSDRFEAVRYSRRFHHPNAAIRSGEVYSYDRHLEDLLEVIDAIGREIALVGHSSGGVLALLAAGRRSGLVRRLVLVEPAIFGRVVSDPPNAAEIVRLTLSDPALAASLIRFAVTALEPARRAARRGRRDDAMRAFGRGVLGAKAFGRLSRERQRQVEDNFLEAELTGPGLPPISAEDVAAVTCPTLVVAGDESPVYFRRLARRLAGELADARLLVLPGASHLVHEDAPEAFDGALLKFLGSREPA